MISVLGDTSMLKMFKVLRKLGNGNFGSVFEVQATGTEAGTKMACKQMPKTEKGLADFQQVQFDQLA